MIIAFLLFSLCFIVRYSIAASIGVNFDTYGHLYLSKEVKAHRIGPFGAIRSKVVCPKDFSHPFLWNFVISFFNVHWILKNNKLLNPIMDSAFTVLIFIILIFTGFDQGTAFRSALLYILTPMWFSQFSIGPRTASLTPRLSSEIFFNLLLIVTLMPLPIRVPTRLIMGAFCSFVVFSSSKFGVQAILFIVPLTSLFSLNHLPFTSSLLGFLLALTISRGIVLMNLKEQMLHLTGYFKKNLLNKMAVSSRNSLRKLFAWDRDSHFLKNILKIGLRALTSNSFTGVLLKMPVLLFVIAGVFLNSEETLTPAFFSIAPIAAACILFFLINIPFLLFLGEAERYLNHVAFFIVTSGAFLTDLAYSFLIAYGVLFWATELVALYFVKKKSVNSYADVDSDIISWLKSRAGEMTILSYPYHAVGVFRIMLQTDHRVLFCFMCEEEFQREFLEKYEDDYPYVKLDLIDEMASRYGVNCLIINKKTLIARGFEEWEPSENWIAVSVGQPVYDMFIHTSISDEALPSPDRVTGRGERNA